MKKLDSVKFISMIMLLLCAGNINAQLVNCNVFLKGTLLEVGIAPNGAYGASEQSPAGYHNNVSDSMYNSCTFALTVANELGFVADPNMTGWTAYYGDYVLPGGIPNEGFAMSDSTGSATAYSTYYHAGFTGFTGALSGSNTNYWIAGTTKQGEWDGVFGADSISVFQTTIIDTASLYMAMHIVFANLHDTAADTFYYVRTINPHNEAVLTSSLDTKLKIEDQLPNINNFTVVSASGITHPDAYIALGTADSRARGFIISDSTLPVSGNLASIYYGDTVNYLYKDSVNGNLGMGLIFRIILGAGDSTSLNFGYSFKSGIIDSILGDTIVTTTLKASNLASGQHISVYPNPTNNFVNVAGLLSGQSLTLYDVLGRTVYQNLSTSQGVNSLSMGNLASGSYILTVKDLSGNVISRTRIQKD